MSDVPSTLQPCNRSTEERDRYPKRSGWGTVDEYTPPHASKQTRSSLVAASLAWDTQHSTQHRPCRSTNSNRPESTGEDSPAGRVRQSKKPMPSSLTGTVLKKKWKLGALVGKGGCAEVYEAIDVRASESAGSAAAGGGPFVAKIAPLPVGLPPTIHKGKKRKKTDQEKHADMIYYEYTLYQGFLAGHGGVVQVKIDILHPDVIAAADSGSSAMPE